MSKTWQEESDLENEWANSPQFGDTVIEVKTGDVGMITEMDVHGRPYHVTFRNGARQWVEREDIYVI